MGAYRESKPQWGGESSGVPLYLHDLPLWNGERVEDASQLPVLRLYHFTYAEVQEMARAALNYQPSIEVHEPQDVTRFLLACRYASDLELFGKEDHWQTPAEFERLRAGDCEDHALWAWRMGVALGEEARFTIGTLSGDPHAWVTMYEEGLPWILEATGKTPETIEPFRPNGLYEPRFSIDGKLLIYRHRRA